MRAFLVFAIVIAFAVLAALFVGRRLERAMLTHGVMTEETEACPRCFQLAPLNGTAADGSAVCIPCLEREVDLPRVEAEAAGEARSESVQLRPASDVQTGREL